MGSGIKVTKSWRGGSFGLGEFLVRLLKTDMVMVNFLAWNRTLADAKQTAWILPQ